MNFTPPQGWLKVSLPNPSRNEMRCRARMNAQSCRCRSRFTLNTFQRTLSSYSSFPTRDNRIDLIGASKAYHNIRELSKTFECSTSHIHCLRWFMIVYSNFTAHIMWVTLMTAWSCHSKPEMCQSFNDAYVDGTSNIYQNNNSVGIPQGKLWECVLLTKEQQFKLLRRVKAQSFGRQLINLSLLIKVLVLSVGSSHQNPKYFLWIPRTRESSRQELSVFDLICEFI